jgi:hypothetical protein
LENRWSLDLLGRTGIGSLPFSWGLPENPYDTITVLVPSAGGAIAIGVTDQQVFAVRMGLDGTLDPRWGRGGSLQLPDRPVTALPAPGDGVVLGGSDFLGWIDGRGRIAWWRSLSDRAVAAAVAVDRRGRVLVARQGGGRDVEDRRRLAVLRFTRHGQLDRSFGTQGRLQLRVPGFVRWPRLLVYDDGRVDLLANTYTHETYLREDIIVPTATVIWRLRG